MPSFRRLLIPTTVMDTRRAGVRLPRTFGAFSLHTRLILAQPSLWVPSLRPWNLWYTPIPYAYSYFDGSALRQRIPAVLILLRPSTFPLPVICVRDSPTLHHVHLHGAAPL